MNEFESTNNIWPPRFSSPVSSQDSVLPPAGAWIIAMIDLLVGAVALVGTLNARPVAADDGLGAFDWLIFFLDFTNAVLLLAVSGCVFRQRERALRLASSFQRWAAWTFFLYGTADIGLSLVIVNESLTGTFTFLGGLVLLVPAALSFWASRYLAKLGR